MQNKADASIRRYERLTLEDDQSDIGLTAPRRGAPITVLIADDHPVIRDGLTRILNFGDRADPSLYRRRMRP